MTLLITRVEGGGDARRKHSGMKGAKVVETGTGRPAAHAVVTYD
jgi:hypothetical protein